MQLNNSCGLLARLSSNRDNRIVSKLFAPSKLSNEIPTKQILLSDSSIVLDNVTALVIVDRLAKKLPFN